MNTPLWLSVTFGGRPTADQLITGAPPLAVMVRLTGMFFSSVWSPGLFTTGGCAAWLELNSGEADALLISVEATNEQALAAQCFSDQATATITRYSRIGPVFGSFWQAPPATACQATACQHRPTYQFSAKLTLLSTTVLGVVGSCA